MKAVASINIGQPSNATSCRVGAVFTIRLLQILDNRTLTLTKDIVIDTDIPKYAILSHTWGKGDQEVSFADMVAGKGKSKRGYRKIEFCRIQTRLDGLRYFWIDTCCIDKSNNTELSEAVNSMFRWYQRAAKCYVYLTDVEKATGSRRWKETIGSSSRGEFHVRRRFSNAIAAKQKERADGFDLKREFRASRWFTRGWTLQELLAPFSVEFFGFSGQRLGSKLSLKNLIHEMTGIPIESLEGEDLSYFTIEERMSWSRGRETTRPEDKAYSLLGTFGVHMPLIYGEGGENAFKRLRQETCRYYDRVLERLPIAEGSAFDSHSDAPHQTCLPNTRVDVLRQVDELMKDKKGKAIFWLNGMAGTGKSTIARTVAYHAAESGHLGGSFFFKRGERDRFGTSKFFSTIAAQIVRKEPSFAFHLMSGLEDDFSICEADLQRQFEELIIVPFHQTFSYIRNDKPILIVIDALDECESETSVKQIINLFSRANPQTAQSPRLRIFVTSRLDIPLRLGFKAVHGTYEDFILHEVPELVIRQDLWIYFQSELITIRKEYSSSVSSTHRQLPEGWPNVSDVRTLVHMATPLFIFAATICRFLANRRYGNPDKNLQTVLKYRTRSQESKLDNMYRPVLDMMLLGLSRRERTEAIHEFRVIVGSIVILAESLSASALSALLGVPQSTVDDRLDMFHSVLHVPSTSTSPVRLLYLSFRDFLTDPDKRETYEFWIDERQAHRRLAVSCLQIMDRTLQKNICKGDWPSASIYSFDIQTIRKNLPPEVKYACQYWPRHLNEAGDDIWEASQVHDFLKRHFLHWLEALSLVRKVIRSIEAIKYWQSKFQRSANVQLLEFLAEANRFIKENINLIETTPLHIYCLALVLAPEGSIIKNTFRHELPK
ncbi:hypothetical protein GGR58DRAFT_466746 [Xylaria digitata]|nr:hypothetical protein GGR58DRAFT_466746 [Xylaria digitata]